MPSRRVLSLLPSITEIVCALGAGDRLVGRSHECDHPPHVTRLPVCTAPKIDASRPSAAIDADVKALVRDGLSVYRVDADVLRRLAPDTILTQDQCEVCAVTPRDVESALAELLGERPRVVSLAPQGLDDVWRDVERVADALGVPERGRELVGALTGRVEALSADAASTGQRPRVALLEWIDPLMAAGNWLPELATRAGGECVLGEARGNAPWTSLEALAAADPDVVVVVPCGFDVHRTRREMVALTRHPSWQELRAVRIRRVFLADGNQYFNRPGPRLVESLEILVEILHPELRFGHEGRGWERF